MDKITEVIIVDNGSIDNSIEMAIDMMPSVVVIRNATNEGFAGPCNKGAEVAKGDLLLFLNNDVILLTGALETMIHEILPSEIAAVGPKIIKSNGGLDSAGSFFTLTGFLSHISQEKLTELDARKERFSLKGACLLVKKTCFFEAGGFDSSFFAYFEESDLCWRLLLRGYVLHFVADASVVHEGGRTVKKIFASHYIDFLSFRNRIMSIRRNLRFTSKVLVIPLHLLCCLVFSFIFLLSGKPKNSASIIKAICIGMLTPIVHLPPTLQNYRKGSLIEIRALLTRPSFSELLSMLKQYLIRW